MASGTHLFAEDPTPRAACQLGQFDGPGDLAEVIAQVKRAVNERHGRFVLRIAATLPLVGDYGDPSDQYDVCDMRRRMCY